MSKKKSYKDFSEMISNFHSNWGKIEKTADKKQKILDQLKKQGDMWSR